MAVTSTIEYCTDRQMQDIYPHDLPDLKRRLYNFIKSDSLKDLYDTTIDLYYLNGSDLVTELFFNGSKVDKIRYTTTVVATLDGAISGADTTGIDIDLIGGTIALAADDIIKIDDEYIRIAAMSDSTTIVAGDRGCLGSASLHHITGSRVYLFIDGSIDVQDAASGSDAPSFVYDSDLDNLIIVSDTDINQHIMEAGDSWSSIKTRFRRKASRLIESYLDNRLAREVLKDREGNYPEIIIHVTALQAVVLLLKAHDPTN